MCICIYKGLVFVLVFIFASCLLIFDIFDERGHCGEQCGALLGYLAREPHLCVFYFEIQCLSEFKQSNQCCPQWWQKVSQDLAKTGAEEQQLCYIRNILSCTKHNMVVVQDAKRRGLPWIFSRSYISYTSL